MRTRTIFLVIPRRISVRYMLSSQVFQRLRGTPGLRLVIVTSIKDPQFIEEFAGPNVVCEMIPLRTPRDEMWIEQAIRRFRKYVWAVSENVDTISIQIREKSSILFLIHCFLAKCAFLLKPLPFLLGYADLCFISPWSDKRYIPLFKKYNPDVVCVHSVFELTTIPVARIARRRKVPLLGIVISWDQLTSKGHIPVRYDRLLVWNEIMKSEAIDFHGYQPKEISITGTPQFDFYITFGDRFLSRDAFFKKMGLDPERKLIVYTTTPPQVGTREPEMIQFLAESVSQHRFKVPCQVLVRVYSKDIPSRYESISKLLKVIVDYQDNVPLGLSYRETDIYILTHLGSTIKNADVVVNVASTVTIDAALFDVPVVNVALDRHYAMYYSLNHYRNIVAAGAVRVAYTEEDLLRWINVYLQNPRLDQEGRRRIVQEQCGTVDGRAGERVAKEIIEFLSS